MLHITFQFMSRLNNTESAVFVDMMCFLLPNDFSFQNLFAKMY